MLRRRLQRLLPDETTLRERRGLKWLGPLLGRRGLWHLSRRRVAAGAAIGVFFGLLIPVLQIALSAIAAVALRTNLPVAAVSTLVSNPFTFVPIGVAVYTVGTLLLGDPAAAAQAELAVSAIGEATDIGWLEWGLGIGQPLFIGLAVFAVVGATVTWIGVNAIWIVAVRRRWARRRSR
jgi:uncharacterized protein (DUF2062 family)